MSVYLTNGKIYSCMHPKQNKDSTDYVAKETKEVPEKVYINIVSTVKLCICILDINI